MITIVLHSAYCNSVLYGVLDDDDDDEWLTLLVS